MDENLLALSDVDDAIEAGIAVLIDENDRDERLISVGDYYVYIDTDGYVFLIDSGYEPQDVDEARECQMRDLSEDE